MRYNWIDEYLLSKRGVTKNTENWNWIRYQIVDKMFAAVCCDEAGVGPMSRLWTQKVELFSPYLIARRDVSYAARASSSTCCGVL